jgi:hypothetical protein
MEEIERKAKSNGERDAFPELDGGGLNKREWLAGMALQGLLANHENRTSYEAIAVDAIRYSDALLKQLAESDGAK